MRLGEPADAAKAAAQALKDWRSDADGVATEAAEAQEQALTERVTKVETEAQATIEKLTPSLAGSRRRWTA